MADSYSSGWYNTPKNDQLPTTPPHSQQPADQTSIFYPTNSSLNTPQSTMNIRFGDPQYYPGAHYNTGRSPLQAMGQFQIGNNAHHLETYPALNFNNFANVPAVGQQDDNNLTFFSDLHKSAALAAQDNENDENDENDKTHTPNPQMNDKASTNIDANPKGNTNANANMNAQAITYTNAVASAATKQNAKNVPKNIPKSKTATRDKSTPARATKKTKPAGEDTKSKKGGLGSKSGVLNRREVGGSDDEVELLDPEDVKDAGVIQGKGGWTDEDKTAVVKYITSPDIWKDFKVKQAKEFVDISQKCLGGRKDAEAVRNLWNRLWKLYKIARRRQEHTGGGDGDDESDEGEIVENDGSGQKRKRKPKKAATKPRFSKRTIDAFEESIYYQLIDRVAHDNDEVVRTRAFSSGRAISDDDDDKTPRHGRKKSKKSADSDDESEDEKALLKELVQSVDTRQAARAELEAEKLKTEKEALELARQRDQREVRFAEERWAYEKEAKEREARTSEERDKIKAELQEQLLKEKKLELEQNVQTIKINEATLKHNQWSQVMKMLEHKNPIVRARGEQMAKKLADEEGIIYDA